VHVSGIPRGRLLLRVSVAGLALDSLGRPRIVGRRDAATWLRVRPQTISAGRAGANVVVTSRRPSGAHPGDHTAIVLLAATAPSGKTIAVAMRVGLVVTVRVSGRSIRRVEVVAARARPTAGVGRLIAVTIANRGDRIESVGGTRLAVKLARRGRAAGRCQGPRRALLPHTSAVVTVRCRAAGHGGVVARIALLRPDGKTATRSFRLHL
jgi:hypothetical protein